jgi:hypothetical protein
MIFRSNRDHQLITEQVRPRDRWVRRICNHRVGERVRQDVKSCLGRWVPSVVDMQGYWDDLGLHWPLTLWSILSSFTYPGLHSGEYHPDRHGCLGPGDSWDSAILGLVESQKTPTFNRRKTGGQTMDVWGWLRLRNELYMLRRFWNSIWGFGELSAGDLEWGDIFGLGEGNVCVSCEGNILY